MVSLENRIAYSLRINESQKLGAFNNLLLNKPIVLLQGYELSEPEEIYFGIVSAIQMGDKTAFEKHYSKKNKSKPSKDSPAPFVNDDFLIFSIILGVTKFNIDKSWIKSIVLIRSKNAVTTTLDNLLEDNFYSTSNLPEIVLMFLQLTNQELITNNFLDFTFKRIKENSALLESKSDLQILCAINAFDLIILLKEEPDGSEISLLKTFNSKFTQRAKILSWILQVGLLIGLLYGLLRLPIYSPTTVDLLNKYGYVFSVLGALGFTLLGNQLEFIRRKSQEVVMRMLGYPKELIKAFKEK